ncbi:ParB family chromosome partitioning protein [Nocardioides ginsengisegetis]|uniref:ParB family chromosome partitioning protein n=1 Tax=Nocardioides ginsengisegetis TaxID=661491 RepID=A0A7W3IYV7_9ACTN|nr:ParB N-terminal domain-containing protein [Nocardioides ginsengisegetis]MBA8803215.1 ParB family chromosome partitioning protein [Nocardioides ginsengisegetis]
MPDGGHIELERSVESIAVGVRHRQDLGDLAPLVASIDRLGLLQPITIAPDGTLLCGRRRLEAIRLLRWQSVKVWVRSGLSDELNSLLAQQDDNLLHKPLSVLEAASLYRELKVVLAEDAARRQRATQFGAPNPAEAPGGAESAPPSPPGKSRRQAAELVTGTAAYNRLEQVNGLEDIAADETQPAPVRGLAATALHSIRDGSAVNPWFNEVREIRDDGRAMTDDELERLAQQALQRIDNPVRRRPVSAARHKRSTRAFVHTWTDMDGWSSAYDATEIGAALTDQEWALFDRVLQETVSFHQAAQRRRTAPPATAAG